MTPMDALANWPFAVWLRSAPMVYPTLETIHIFGLGLVFGTIVVVDVAILRRSAVLKTLAGQLLPWTIVGFLIAATTGSVMFLARSSDFISNNAFILKMILISFAGVNAALLHTRGALDASNVLTRVQAGASLCLWLTIVSCGRWIAYV